MSKITKIEKIAKEVRDARKHFNKLENLDNRMSVLQDFDKYYVSALEVAIKTINEELEDAKKRVSNREKHLKKC